MGSGGLSLVCIASHDSQFRLREVQFDNRDQGVQNRLSVKGQGKGGAREGQLEGRKRPLGGEA
jgi:hypothetical protein